MTKRNIIMAGLVVVSSFLGGFFSNIIMAGSKADAQTSKPADFFVKCLKTEKLEIVDKNGETRAYMNVMNDGTPKLAMSPKGAGEIVTLHAFKRNPLLSMTTNSEFYSTLSITSDRIAIQHSNGNFSVKLPSFRGEQHTR